MGGQPVGDPLDWPVSTSLKLSGEDADRFRAYAALRGMRPHELTRWLVAEGLVSLLADPQTGTAVRRLTAAARQSRQERLDREALDNVVPISRGRRA